MPRDPLPDTPFGDCLICGKPVLVNQLWSETADGMYHADCVSQEVHDAT